MHTCQYSQYIQSQFSAQGPCLGGGGQWPWHSAGHGAQWMCSRYLRQSLGQRLGRCFCFVVCGKSHATATLAGAWMLLPVIIRKPFGVAIKPGQPALWELKYLKFKFSCVPLPKILWPFDLWLPLIFFIFFCNCNCNWQYFMQNILLHHTLHQTFSLYLPGLLTHLG